MATPLLARTIQPSTRPRSERRLSEVTKKLAIPRGIVTTGWPEINEVCSEQMGIEFDGWQRGMGTLMLGKKASGMLAHTVGGFHLSAMRQIGKALDTATPVLTANRGWTTMGDVVVGDRVFHPSGTAVAVTETHPIGLNRDCYEVTMTDGRRVVADGEHLWTVRDKRRLGAPWRTLTTVQMLEDGLSRALAGGRSVTTQGKQYRTTESRFVLPRQHTLDDLAHVDVPIDPYLLGAWLGDGISVAARLTSGDEDIDHWVTAINAAGFTASPRKPRDRAWSIGITSPGRGRLERSFARAMLQLDLYDNRHIPDEYLRGSTWQRLALLQGLLDTDGHITKSGTIEFCSMTKDLADGVLFLARSLGWRATLGEGKAKLDGRDYGIKYRVTFTPKTSDPFVPFRLQRKIDRISTTDGNKGRFTVSIKSIEPVATRPVRCIKVDSEDGLFLAGRDLIATHNTYFFAGGLFGLCVKYPGLLAIWSAHHSKTHNETFQSMQAFALRRRVAPFIQKVYTGSGDEEIRFHNGSRILFGARERGFGRGIPGVDVLVSDEGQILSEKAMQAMLATLNTSWLGLHIYAGTPPRAEEIDKAESWMRARGEAWIGGKDAPMQVETEDMVWIEIGADDGCDLDDRDQWLKNPSYPHRTPLEAFMRLRRKLNDEGWRREGLGLYDEDDGSIFDIERWNTLAVEDAEQPGNAYAVLDVSPDARWSCIGIAGDLAVSSDVDDERGLVMVKSFPGFAGAVKALTAMWDEGKLLDVAITSGAARAVETDLTKAGVEYETISQSDMAAAYANLQKSIKDGSLAHLDQPELNFAMINSKSRYLQTGEAQAFDRREYSVDTSPAVSAAGALYRYGMGDGLPFIG